ncbi:unnamed protein product [Allacma fusca]|uniref:Uncharacterized protein n=1 Tax=Allacma fusca TaxID=39272 RepID=A0A8J2NII2_9HEXA|nr:unnamed protein product [Allacma fusca]
MKLLILPLFVCLFSFAYAGFFNFGVGRDMDIFIRESNNSRCRWYNSGILSWIPRRINETTYCRCIGVGAYECKTYIPKAKTTVVTDSTGLGSNSTASTAEISISSKANSTTAPTALP